MRKLLIAHVLTACATASAVRASSLGGKRFYIDNLDAGFTVVDGVTNTLSLIASPGYDRIFFYRSDLQNIFVNVEGAAGTTPPRVPFPSRSRPITYLAGPEWTFNIHDVIGQFDVLREVTGHNHGEEVRAGIKLPVTRSAGALSATIGLTWQSTAIVEASARRFGIRNWYFDVTVNPRSPVYSLAATFRKMAARIDGLIASHRDMSNAVSHEIRTPLSRMQFEIELAQAAGNLPEVRESLVHIRKISAPLTI
jgi:signal transduction histidine kinase